MGTQAFIGNAAAAARLTGRARGHAYLLTGPDGIGKRTLADRFAAALLCERADGPCRVAGTSEEAMEPCPSCKLREAGNHPDYHRLPAEGNLTIAQVRELSRALGLSPHSGRHQVGLVPDAERLGVPAQNALLKLLEEPPRHAVLVLTAPSPASLLPTTVSRCQRVPLGPVPADELVAALKDRGVQDANAVASRAGERPGTAIRLADDPDADAAVRESESALLDVVRRSVPERLALAKRLADDPEALPGRLDAWIGIYRASLRNSGGPAAERLAETVPLAKRIDGLIRLFAARRKLRYNPNTQLLLEQLFLNIGT
ncbi:MAG TPA: DNA polymerase III subunit delta' [Patescibacteria group bacterium]|jgi:DNA polymerase-3 subunit delta'